MDTIDSLIKRGYRIYKVQMKLNSTLKHYFRVKMGLLVDYHEILKVITVRDAKSEGGI